MDREKVIKALEICEEKDCALCPYTDWCGEYDDCYIDCTKLLAKDALALLKELEHKDRMFHALEDDWKRLKGLLKEQEAIVHPEPSCEMTYITDCCCDLCGEQLIRDDNFCRCCGKHILWKDR